MEFKQSEEEFRRRISENMEKGGQERDLINEKIQTKFKSIIYRLASQKKDK